jgi:hypothetical protein
VGRHCAAPILLALLACCALAADPVLEVHLGSGAVLAQWPMAAGQELCLTWAHSVTGGRVADCFVNDAGRFTLQRSYLHDFAAGLGEVAGRGTVTPAEDGGYWIDAIAEAMPDNVLLLRIGAPQVGHELRLGARHLALSEIAPGQRARIMLKAD